MNSDVKLTKVEEDGNMTELLIFKLKNPKESKGASVNVVPGQSLQELEEGVQVVTEETEWWIEFKFFLQELTADMEKMVKLSQPLIPRRVANNDG